MLNVTRYAAALTAALTASAALADPPSQATKARAEAAVAWSAASAPEKCTCAAARVLTWDAGSKKGLADRSVVVVFAGVEPRCVGDAIPVRMTLADAGAGFSEAKPIAVYYPDAAGQWKATESLPKDASAAEIKAAVRAAKAKVGR